MPIFLSQEQLYRLLERELPEDTYIDGAPSAGFSTADMNAVAFVGAAAYSNLQRIYDNYFPQYADERIGDWEITVFDQLSDSTLTLQDRRDRVVNKLRARPGITKQDMLNAVTATFPFLAPSGAEIIEWGCTDGGWLISESQLGISTFLNGSNGVEVVNGSEDLCDDNPAAHGLTPEEWAIAQQEAYTFEVRIFNYTLSADQYALLDKVMTAAEPARSTHVITSGLTDADRVNGDT